MFDQWCPSVSRSICILLLILPYSHKRHRKSPVQWSTIFYVRLSSFITYSLVVLLYFFVVFVLIRNSSWQWQFNFCMFFTDHSDPISWRLWWMSPAEVWTCMTWDLERCGIILTGRLFKNLGLCHLQETCNNCCQLIELNLID